MKALSHKRARSLLHIPDKDLSAVQQADLANHLAGCPECQMYAADLRKLQQVLIRAMDTRWDNWYPSTTSSHAIQRRWKEEKMKRKTVKLIAVLACLVAIIALITYGPGFVSSPLAVSVPPTETQVPIAETQTTPTVVEINQELSSFHAPNHYGLGDGYQPGLESRRDRKR